MTEISLGPAITLSKIYDDLSDEYITQKIIGYLENTEYFKNRVKENLSNQIKYCRESTGFLKFETRRTKIDGKLNMIVEIFAIFNNMDNAIMAKLGL